MTVTNRILIQVAIGAALVIAVSTAVTYAIVYDAARQHGLAQLDTYVAERTEREEAFFQQIQSNLELVREQFLRRDAFPPPRDYQQQWDKWFEKFPDGAWRSRKEFSDGRKWSTLWMHKGVELTPELMTQILRANNITNDFLPGWVDSFPSLYFVFTYDANIGFDPRIPSWVWDTPADYSNNSIEAVAACNEKNNPSRQIVWNSVIPEPTSRLPYISVMLPVDVNGKQIAALGHDIHALRLLDSSTHSGLRGAAHFIFRQDGRLIVHREKMPEILAHDGRLMMQDCGDPAMKSLYQAAMGHTERRFTGYDAVSDCYYAISRLAGPEWFFITTMPQKELQQTAFQSAQWVLWSGLVSLALLLAFFAAILRRQIARPLADFFGATQRLAAGEAGVRIDLRRDDELGQLARAFNEMEEQIEARTDELRDSEQRWRALFEQSPLSVQIFASDGTTRLVNRGYEKFWKIGLPALANYNVLKDPQLEENGVAPLLRRAFAGEVVAVPAAPYDPGRNPDVDGEAAGLRWLSALLYPLLDEAGKVREVICIHEDITERKKAEDEIRALNQSLEQRVATRTAELQCTNRELQQEIEQRTRAEASLKERMRIAALGADVSGALNEHSALRPMLQRCTESLVRHFDVAFARIWTLNDAAQVLELQASAGCYTHIDGLHSHVPVGKYKIGLIAQEKQPHQTNEVLTDPRVSDKDWARREGMVSFAGYPLMLEGRVLGVVAMFSRRPLGQETLQALEAVAYSLALGIERKRAEARLRESEERFSKAFQASPAMMALTRLADGTFIAANEAFYKISGFTEGEVIGQTSMNLNIYAQPAQRDEYVRLLHLSGSVRDREHFLRTKAGLPRTVLISGELLDLDGQPHVLTVGLDITDRKEAEIETLKALDREKELSELKSNFVSMVSHEFRTPLGVIMSAADVLDRYLDRLGPEDRREHLDMIFRSTRNLAQLVESVLLLGKVEDGRLQFTPAPVDLPAQCEQLVDEILSATGHRCPIQLVADSDLAGARSDADLLRHIVTNILSNAVKYSSPGIPVEFTVDRVDGNVVLSVRDQGIGIAPEDQANLFKSFARGRNVGQRPGSGLGLLIVKRCAEQHGGRVEIASALGEGTVVTVTLPVFSI
jgi:PAS domain S-box-containing protein